MKDRHLIVEDIMKVVQEKARRDGYSLVIDKTGQTLSGVPPFLFVQDALDITADVIKTLNAGATAGVKTAPAAGKGEAKDKK